jgi:hypothetical protein
MNRMSGTHRSSFLLPGLILVLLLGGCASWDYTALALPEQIHDVHHAERHGVAVSVGILTDEEAKAHFGVDLGDADIQAIWMRVENGSDLDLWFLRAVLDPDFYPADEVAMVVRRQIHKEDFASLRQRLRNESMRLKLVAGSTAAGFVFTPKAVGGRYVDIRLVQDVFQAQQSRDMAQQAGEEASDNRDIEFRFGFALPLPDGIFDYERLDPDSTYPDMGLPDLSTEELRAQLAALPCCSTDADNEKPGDPLNIVIVGRSADVLNSLSRAGWSFTHRITARSVSRMVGSALAGDSYPVAPVSPLNAFGRKQDFALQRARTSIAQRNHMRLWLAPFTYRGTQVWLGQISRDIGIKLSPDSPTITTHIIDPEVDQAREYLLQSMLAGGFVEAFGFVEGSRAASREDPARNLVNDPYFSDGLRLVVLLSPEPVPYSNVRSLLWRESAAPVTEGQAGSE